MRLYRVLFVCIGNACRSQMAEGFARAYGSDVLIARSAGLKPCDMVSPNTVRLMLERGVDLDGCTPKPVPAEELDGFDLVVNMSGWAFPYRTSAPVRAWKVEDPIWFNDERHREVRNQIEGLVRGLVEEFRARHTARKSI